tara:strand:- start:3178 stop:8994 length:5817 start_codon:yes stop_codon:yes gene_type:complete
MQILTASAIPTRGSTPPLSYKNKEALNSKKYLENLHKSLYSVASEAYSLMRALPTTMKSEPAPSETPPNVLNCFNFLKRPSLQHTPLLNSDIKFIYVHTLPNYTNSLNQIPELNVITTIDLTATFLCLKRLRDAYDLLSYNDLEILKSKLNSSIKDLDSNNDHSKHFEGILSSFKCPDLGSSTESCEVIKKTYQKFLACIPNLQATWEESFLKAFNPDQKSEILHTNAKQYCSTFFVEQLSSLLPDIIKTISILRVHIHPLRHSSLYHDTLKRQFQLIIKRVGLDPILNPCVQWIQHNVTTSTQPSLVINSYETLFQDLTELFIIRAIKDGFTLSPELFPDINPDNVLPAIRTWLYSCCHTFKQKSTLSLETKLNDIKQSFILLLETLEFFHIKNIITFNCSDQTPLAPIYKAFEHILVIPKKYQLLPLSNLSLIVSNFYFFHGLSPCKSRFKTDISLATLQRTHDDLKTALKKPIGSFSFILESFFNPIFQSGDINFILTHLEKLVGPLDTKDDYCIQRFHNEKKMALSHPDIPDNLKNMITSLQYNSLKPFPLTELNKFYKFQILLKNQDFSIIAQEVANTNFFDICYDLTRWESDIKIKACITLLENFSQLDPCYENTLRDDISFIKLNGNYILYADPNLSLLNNTDLLTHFLYCNRESLIRKLLTPNLYSIYKNYLRLIRLHINDKKPFNRDFGNLTPIMACPDKFFENPELKILFSTVYFKLNDHFHTLEADWNDSYTLFFEILKIKTTDDLKSKLQMTFPEALFSPLTFRNTSLSTRDTPLSTSQSLQLLLTLIINIRPIITSNRIEKLPNFIRYLPDPSLAENLMNIWKNLKLQVDFYKKNYDLHTFLAHYHTILYDLSYHIISEYIHKTSSVSALSLLGKLLPSLSNDVFSSWLLSNHYELNNHFDFFDQDYEKFLQSFEKSFESLQKTLDCLSILNFIHSDDCPDNQKLYPFFNNLFRDSSLPVKSIEDISNKILSLTKDRSIPATYLQTINDKLAFSFKKPMGTSTIYLEYFFNFLKSSKTADVLTASLFRLIPSNTNKDSECITFFKLKKLALALIDSIDCDHEDVKNVILSLKYYCPELNSFFPYESSNTLLNSYIAFYTYKRKYLQKFSGSEKEQLKTYNFPEKTRADLDQFHNFYILKQTLLKEFSKSEKEQLKTYNFPEKTRADLEYFHNFYTLKLELLKLYPDAIERLRSFDISKDSLDDLKEYQSNKIAENLIDDSSPTPLTNSTKKKKKKKNKLKVLTSSQSNQNRNQLIKNWTSSKKELYDLLIKHGLLDQPCSFADIDSIKTLLGINNSQKISYKSSGTELTTLQNQTSEFKRQISQLSLAINKHHYNEHCKKLNQLIKNYPNPFFNTTKTLNEQLESSTFSRPITQVSDLSFTDESCKHLQETIDTLNYIYKVTQEKLEILQQSFNKYKKSYQDIKYQIEALAVIEIEWPLLIKKDTFSQLNPSLIKSTNINQNQNLLDSIQSFLKDIQIFINSYQPIFDDLSEFMTKKDDLTLLLTNESKKTILTQLLEKSVYYNNLGITTLSDLRAANILSCNKEGFKDSLDELKVLFQSVKNSYISSVANSLSMQILKDHASLTLLHLDPTNNHLGSIDSDLQTLKTKLQQPIETIDYLTCLYNDYQQLKKTNHKTLRLNSIQTQSFQSFNTPLSPIPEHIKDNQVTRIISGLNSNIDLAQKIKRLIKSGATVYIYGSSLFKQNYNDVDILILDQNTEGITTEQSDILIAECNLPVDLHIANIGTYDPAIIGRSYNESVVAQLMINDDNQLTLKGYYSAHASALSPDFDTFNHHTSFYGFKHQLYLLKRYSQLIHKHQEKLLSPTTCNKFFDTFHFDHYNEPALFTVIKNTVKTILTTSNIPNVRNLKFILDALYLFQHSKWLNPALISEFSNRFFGGLYQEDLYQAFSSSYKKMNQSALNRGG